MIDPGAEEKLEKLIKMLSSDRDGEVIAAARAIQRTLSSAGTDIHELAGRIKGRKLSELEMRKIYDAAYRDGKEAAAVDKGFESVDGAKPWHKMALFCLEHIDSKYLYPSEPEFIRKMVRRTEYRDPSEKEGKWLGRIYERLGRRQ